MQDPMDELINPLKHSVEVSNNRNNKSRKISVAIEDEKLDELESKNSELIRSLADLQNYLKIQQRDFQNQSKTRGREIISNLLPFLDSLDAAISSNKDSETVKSLRDNILGILGKMGLKPIESEKQKVNVKCHEVVGVVEGDEDNMIAHEIQKGYFLNDEVIRTSKVIVNKKGE